MNKEHLLHKVLNNEATKEEWEDLKNSPEYASYLKIIEATSGFKTPRFKNDPIFEKINSKIKLKTKVRRLSPLRSIIKIAAVFAVLFVGYLYVSTLNTTVETQIAEKENFLLPDASQVTLNANSTIDYNKNNWGESRALTLDGEAYFKVTKGNTFSVNTPQGTVRVLGTQFNIFSRDTIFNIYCYEGVVSVAFNNDLIKLPAGNALKIENGILKAQNKTNATAPNWITNESSFENATLGVVLNELENQYPIKIHSEKNILNRRFSGSFTQNNLNLALKSVCDPLQLDFTIKGEAVTIYAKNSSY